MQLLVKNGFNQSMSSLVMRQIFPKIIPKFPEHQDLGHVVFSQSQPIGKSPPDSSCPDQNETRNADPYQGVPTRSNQLLYVDYFVA